MNQWWHWLETKYSAPEFGGMLLLFLTVFFFGAATNTLSGWLYVISGASIALLLVGALLPIRILHDLAFERPPISPVHAGDPLYLELWIANKSKAARSFLELKDCVPENLSSQNAPRFIIDQLSPGQTFRWQYSLPTQRRGVYSLDCLEISTASPLGLFRSKRQWLFPRSAVVYPLVLPLSYCPLIDQMGIEENPRPYTLDFNFQTATEGLTKNLRPYRWGDPMRLIHWRTSARFGELRIRELEITTGGQEIIVALDTRSGWTQDTFEQAVIAAASLFEYGEKHHLQVSFWSAETGRIYKKQEVLVALASIQPQESGESPPAASLLWLTARSADCDQLPPGSCWLYWGEGSPLSLFPGIVINPEEAEKNLPMALQSQPL